MNRPDWKEMADDDGYEDGSFMVIGRVGPNENIIDEHENVVRENIIEEHENENENSIGDHGNGGAEQKETVDTPSPCELLPEEVRQIMETPSSIPASFPEAVVAKSCLSLAESLTPSFVTGIGEHPSLTTNGSSLSNSSTEAIFDNATNQVAHLTEENQILKRELEKNRELTKKNIETWRLFEVSAAEQHKKDKEKHEESRQLVLKLHEEREQLKSKILCLESQMSNQQDSLINPTDLNYQLKSLEAKVTVKDENLRRLKTMLEENEALLNAEKHQTQLLKNLLREQEVASRAMQQSVNEAQPSSVAEVLSLRNELENEKIQNEIMMDTLRKEFDVSRITFGNLMQEKEKEIDTLKREIKDLQMKLDNLHEYNGTLENDSESSRRALLRLENQFEQLQSENILLTTKVAAMKAENDHVDNLKQEMEAFRSDYLTEREHRSKVEEEKSTLLLQLDAVKEELTRSQNELEHLHKTHLTFATEHVNREEPFVSLTERNSISPPNASSTPMVLGNKIMGFFRNEIFRSRDDEAAAIGTPGPSSSRDTESVNSTQEPAIPSCPICGKVFDNLTRLQKHASICGLDNESVEFTDPFVFP